jgi:hypothetical protein
MCKEGSETYKAECCRVCRIPWKPSERSTDRLPGPELRKHGNVGLGGAVEESRVACCQRMEGRCRADECGTKPCGSGMATKCQEPLSCPCFPRPFLLQYFCLNDNSTSIPVHHPPSFCSDFHLLLLKSDH